VTFPAPASTATANVVLTDVMIIGLTLGINDEMTIGASFVPSSMTSSSSPLNPSLPLQAESKKRTSIKKRFFTEHLIT
jgi:hypothetical protein